MPRSDSSSIHLGILLNTLDLEVEQLVEHANYFLGKESEYFSKRREVIESGDPTEVAYLEEVYRLNKQKVEALLLLLDLMTLLSKNPFPGERKRLSAVSNEVLPHAHAHGFVGKQAWKLLFTDIRIPPDIIVNFPQALKPD